MTVPRWSWLAGLVSLFVGPLAVAAEGDVRGVGKNRDSRRPPVALGLLADAGLPDGVNAALALRPARWLRLHVGGGHNTVSSGLRGGVAVLPLGAGPSINFEVGHYRDGNANGFVRGLVGADRWLSPLFERLGYTYVNMQLGLELGRGDFQFFVHGGASYLRAVIHNAQSVIDERTAMTAPADSPTTVRVTQDPILRAWTPSVKLGMVAYFGGGS